MIVSSNMGVTWEFPGGRPQDQESLRETLEREVLEEACAEVIRAKLLGYVLGARTDAISVLRLVYQG